MIGLKYPGYLERNGKSWKYLRLAESAGMVQNGVELSREIEKCEVT